MSFEYSHADEDPHAQCRYEIETLKELLVQVYKCGRHSLTPELQRDIRDYLEAIGRL